MRFPFSFTTVFAAFILVPLMTSCAQRSPLTGLLYSNIQAGVAATPQIGPRVGRACSQSYLGLVATGDSSIEAARLNGGITSIASVDEEMKNIFVVYATHCTIVRGK